ncbi:hypothetical protein ACTQ1L_01485 [Agathobacter sp. LCP21S3_B2]|uniref:hypothetical protein n=1 Tax=Agathobacter sp. LCP21S3_B2 TaxID=3438734 RepID=UPI003F9277A5
MKVKIFDTIYDNVINSYYLTIGVSYKYAIEKFVPLINKLDFQRNPLRKSFYQRLEKDILAGCVMPNITLAIKDDTIQKNIEDVNEEYIRRNIDKAFVLDGIQRLNTMQRVSEENGFPEDRTLYCNILICDSMDKLLYRMITLNNGQKPMTARHQIEILAKNIFDFDSLPILAVTEKDGKNKKKNDESMSKEVLIKGYLAYISNSVNIDNQKIIESKMNELIADQIMDSNIPKKEGEFKDVIGYINDALVSEKLCTWFKVPNNFIGFCAAMNKTYSIIRTVTLQEMEEGIELFEEAFSALDVSKIKLGMARRRMVQKYFEKYEVLSIYSVGQLIDYISMEI